MAFAAVKRMMPQFILLLKRSRLAVVSSDVNRQTADSKGEESSSDGEQEQKAKDTADDTDESTEWCVYICGQVANPGVYRVSRRESL